MYVCTLIPEKVVNITLTIYDKPLWRFCTHVVSRHTVVVYCAAAVSRLAHSLYFQARLGPLDYDGSHWFYGGLHWLPTASAD